MTHLRLAATLFALPLALFCFRPTDVPAQPDKKKPVEPPATDPATMKVAKGFKVELLYSVPKDEMGSWVCMCVDPKGRLIVSDQYGALYRVTPRGLPGKKPQETGVKKLSAKIGMAQGLLWAFDSLYIVVNGTLPDPKDKKKQIDYSGLYRVTSSKNDDE